MEDDLQTIWLNDDLCEARDFRDENEPFLNDDDIIITIICWNERIHDFHCRQQMETRIHKFHMKFLPLASRFSIYLSCRYLRTRTVVWRA